MIGELGADLLKKKHGDSEGKENISEADREEL